MSTWSEITATGKPIADAVDNELTLVTAQRDELQLQVTGLTAENTRLLKQIDALNARITELETQMPKPIPPTPTPPKLKPGLEGLVTTNPAYRPKSIPYAKFASFKPQWKTHNPSPGVFNFDGIDSTLAAHPGIMFRLRFMAGHLAPDWVKARSGGAISHVPNTATGATGMVPRFWTETYFNDYMAFMAAIAKKYEGNPQVVEIPNSLTTTIYAEPFIINADPATVDRYWAAGYRWEPVKNNLLRSMHGMMDLFPTTRISLAGHGKWERIIDGKMNYDWPSERAVFNELISTYGPRLVLDDHGLGADDALGVPQPSDTATTWYNYMAGLEDTPQTYGWQFTPKDYSMTVAAEMGVKMGACFEEFAAFEQIEPTKRRQIHDQLLANAEGKP